MYEKVQGPFYLSQIGNDGRISKGYHAFGVWVAGDPEPVPQIMYAMAKDHGCTRLVNVDADFRQTRYEVVGVVKVKVKATCMN